jgi:hypothetical protein
MRFWIVNGEYSLKMGGNLADDDAIDGLKSTRDRSYPVVCSITHFNPLIGTNSWLLSCAAAVPRAL